MRLPPVSPVVYRRITLVALVALGIIIVTGAAVRLTGSGLGCSDWPTCEQDRFVAPLEYNAMIEFLNRLFTGFVSLAVAVAVLGSLVRVPRRRDLTWWSLGLVVGVLAQIVLGAVVVKFELTPIAVIAHFLVSMVLVWNAVVLHERAAGGGGRAVPRVAPPVVWCGRALVVVATLVLVAGTVVTATGPHGGDEDAERLTFDISAVARNHAVLAWVLLALTIVTLGLAYRGGVTRDAKSRGALLVVAVLVQGAIGYTQYFNGVPPLLVALHVVGSVIVWVAVLRVHLGFFERPSLPTERSGLPADTLGA